MTQAFGGMQAVAEQARLNPTQLYRTLSSKGNPSLASLLAILRAMGLRLAVVPLADAAAPVASRSSLALMTHPRHEANEVHRFSPFPIGIGPENAVHEGYPQTPLATAASWGTVGGLASAAQISALLGSVYIDLDQMQFVGVDGVNVLGAKLNGDKVELQIENVLASLPMPYERSYPIQLRIRGLKPDQEYELLVNGRSVSRETGKSLADFRWTVEPGRSE